MKIQFGGNAKNKAPSPNSRKIKGVAVVMSTAELAGVPNRSMGDKVATLKSKRDEIIAALDMLFTGI